MNKETMKQMVWALEIAEDSVGDLKALEIVRAAIALGLQAIAEAEKQEPVACNNCKKLEHELERLRIKAELWKRDAIAMKSAYEVEVGWNEQNTHPQPKRDQELEAHWNMMRASYAAQPKREWVGLTDEDIDDLVKNTKPHELIKATGVKLKEKNL